jgi:hypothetical protein
MPEAFAKFRVGTPGSGASHASYITRMSALEPDDHRNPATQLELKYDAGTGAGALSDNLMIARRPNNQAETRIPSGPGMLQSS